MTYQLLASDRQCEVKASRLFLSPVMQRRGEMAHPVPTEAVPLPSPKTAMLCASFGCTHQTPFVPPFLLVQNLRLKDIDGSNLTSPKELSLVVKGLTRWLKFWRYNSNGTMHHHGNTTIFHPVYPPPNCQPACCMIPYKFKGIAMPIYSDIWQWVQCQYNILAQTMMQWASYYNCAPAIHHNIGTHPWASNAWAQCQYWSCSPCTHACTK